MAAETFGPYRLVSLLGRGGMGEVWRAVDTRKDREVAVKVLGAWLGGDEDFARRFRREAALAARLHTPHVVPVHDYGEVDGRLFIDMPLIPGPDLTTVLAREGPLSGERATDLVAQTADALDAAHRIGLIHRDVKPSNILVSDSGGGADFVYLIDFGIARRVDGTKISVSGAVIGTPAYMAPERFDGHGDHRSDIYALTCVLFEALTGQPPFPADGLWAHLKAHHDTPPPRPSVARPDLPAELDDVIAVGMAKDPDDRFSTAGALAAAARVVLTRAATPPPVDTSTRASHARQQRPRRTDAPPVPSTLIGTSGPPSARDASGPRRRSPASPTAARPSSATTTRRRGWSNSAVVASLVAVTVLLGVITFSTGSETAATPAGEPSTPRILGGHTDTVNALATTQLDGRAVVVSGSADRTVRVWDIASSRPIGRPLTGHTGGVLAVAVARLDDRPVAVSGGADATVRLWDLASGEPVGRPLAGHGGRVRAVTVTQLDGRAVVVSGGEDDTVRVWDLAAGRPLGEPFASHTGDVNSVAVAQLDGRPVVVSGSSDASVRVWDLGSRQLVHTLPLTSSVSEVYAVSAAQLGGRSVVLAGGSDDAVHRWDLASGRPIGVGLKHADRVFALSVGQLDGRTVVVSGSSQAVRRWDLTTGDQIGKSFDDGFWDTGSVHNVAVATAQVGDRAVVMSGSGDRVIRVWDLAAP